MTDNPFKDPKLRQQLLAECSELQTLLTTIREHRTSSGMAIADHEGLEAILQYGKLAERLFGELPDSVSPAGFVIYSILEVYLETLHDQTLERIADHEVTP